MEKVYYFFLLPLPQKLSNKKETEKVVKLIKYNLERLKSNTRNEPIFFNYHMLIGLTTKG